jgi:hypothetical protein
MPSTVNKNKKNKKNGGKKEWEKNLVMEI